MALKGVPKRIQKSCITFGTLEKILFQQNILACKSKSIRSFKHQKYNIRTTKFVCHGFDSRRYILNNGIHTLPYGHYLIKNKNV